MCVSLSTIKKIAPLCCQASGEYFHSCYWRKFISSSRRFL